MYKVLFVAVALLGVVTGYNEKAVADVTVQPEKVVCMVYDQDGGFMPCAIGYRDFYVWVEAGEDI